MENATNQQNKQNHTIDVVVPPGTLARPLEISLRLADTARGASPSGPGDRAAAGFLRYYAGPRLESR